MSRKKRKRNKQLKRRRQAQGKGSSRSERKYGQLLEQYHEAHRNWMNSEQRLAAAEDRARKAEEKFQREGGEAVVVSCRRRHGHMSRGERWVCSMEIDTGAMIDFMVDGIRSPNAPQSYHVRRIVHEICRKAEDELTKITADLLVGRRS